MLFAFEKLPAELRLRVYEEVLPSGKRLVPYRQEFVGDPWYLPISAILVTNRNIYSEAGAYLYGNNVVDLDSAGAGHVGHPAAASTWQRFGPVIQQVEMDIKIDFLDAYYAIFHGQSVDIKESEKIWQWERNMLDGLASTGLKSLVIDIEPGTGEGALRVRKVALVGMLQWLMKNLVVGRLTVIWLQVHEDGIWCAEEAMDPPFESRGHNVKSVVKHLTIYGLRDFVEARAVFSAWLER